MGNQQQKFASKLANKYDFIEFVKDPTIGPIKIYRKREPFYDYLMVVDRWVNQNDISKHTEQLQQIDKRLKGQNEAMLLKVYGKQVIKDSLKNCGRKFQYRLYLEYLNYNLRSLIDYRNQQKAKFSLDEIMYVLNCMVEMYHFMDSKFSLNKGIGATEMSFHSSEIFLTPEGEIKFNPLQIFPKQESYEADCVETNCMPVKFKKTFRIQDKLIVYEMKKIVTEMTELCDPQMIDDRIIFCFRKKVGICNSVKQVEELLCNSSVDRLEFNPKKSVRSEGDTTKGLSISNGSKISVKSMKK